MNQTSVTPDTRLRLVRAAIEVFAEKGFEAATVRDICTRAEANVAAINYHFGDKKSLYRAIFDDVFRTLRQQRTAFLPRSAPANERLETYVRAFFEELFYCDEGAADGAQLSAMYLMEIAHPTDVLDSVVRDHIAADAQELHDIVSTLLGPAAPRATVLNCAASIAGQVLYYYHSQPLIERLHPDLPAPAERLSELTRHVLRFSMGGIQELRPRGAES
jgi:AcrR family transcriptional regulator